MIMQAIIEQVNEDGTCYINIPNFSKLRKNQNITSGYLANFCVPPNFSPNAKKGDRVYVDFLNNNSGCPIILGYMYFKNPVSEAETDSKYSGSMSDLYVSHETVLPAQTSIGEISSTEISYLKGLSSNLQKQLMQIKERLDILENINVKPNIDTIDKEDISNILDIG